MAKRKNENKTDIQEVVEQGLTWLNVVRPDKQTLAELKKRYPFFMDIDLQDCLPPFQRPKLLVRPDYLFMVTLFPVYDADTGRIRPSEVDFFVDKNFVVTSHAGNLDALTDMADRCRAGIDETSCLISVNGDAARWLYNLLHGLFIGCFPLLTRLSNDIMEAESALGKVDRQTVKDILRIKSNIVDFRKTMQGHVMVLNKFIDRAHQHLTMDGMTAYFEDVMGHAKEIWDFLENDRDTINAVYDSHVSLISLETNEATKTLTALAFILFPMSLMAGLFGMNAQHMPFVGLSGDFWFMLATVGLAGLLVTLYIKMKKWL